MERSPHESRKLRLALDIHTQVVITQILPFPFPSFWYEPIQTYIQTLIFNDLFEAATLALAVWASHLRLRFPQVHSHILGLPQGECLFV